MKTKTVLLTALMALLMGVGCKKEPRYEIYENHDITACGVKDPLKNIDWLAKFCAGNTQSYDRAIYLYENDETKESFFMITNQERDLPFSTFDVSDCSDKVVFYWQSSTPPSPRYYLFFSDKHYKSTLWSVKEVKN